MEEHMRKTSWYRCLVCTVFEFTKAVRITTFSIVAKMFINVRKRLVVDSSTPIYIPFIAMGLWRSSNMTAKELKFELVSFLAPSCQDVYIAKLSCNRPIGAQAVSAVLHYATHRHHSLRWRMCR